MCPPVTSRRGRVVNSSTRPFLKLHSRDRTCKLTPAAKSGAACSPNPLPPGSVPFHHLPVPQPDVEVLCSRANSSHFPSHPDMQAEPHPPALFSGACLGSGVEEMMPPGQKDRGHHATCLLGWWGSLLPDTCLSCQFPLSPHR